MIRFLQTPGPFKKYALSAILVVITISMVWYLVPQGNNSGYNFGGAKQGVVAQVSGDEITSEDVRQAARQMAAQQAQRYGEMANRIMPFLVAQAIPQAAEQLISRQALLTEAGRMGLQVNPSEVRDDLQHGRYAATFFPGGNFIGQQEYEDMLSRANLTPAKFEEALAKTS